MLKSHTVALGDVEIHYVEAPGAGPPVVFAHGFTGSLESYVPIIDELAPDVHCYALDFRGHGQSSKAHTGYRLRDHVADLQAFLTTVVQQPAVVAGHSMGGNTAAWLAALHPVSVRGIILEDPSLYGQIGAGYTTFFERLHTVLREHRSAGRGADELAALIGAWEFEPGKTRRDVFGADGIARHARQWMDLDLAHFSSVISGEGRAGYDPALVLPAIGCPCHLISCPDEEGAALPAADAARALAAIPDCTHTLIPEVSHRIHELKPQEYLGEVRQFLAERIR
jgi:pimeloyl-ACP methyl ester carboxylesterase